MYDVLERMAQNVAPGENGCTRWLGAKLRGGYPSFWHRGRTRPASRVLWEELYGPIPEGLIVRHKCDNTECLNIAHLELGTHKENTQDALSRGRMTGPRKVDDEVVERVNVLRAQKVKVADIAARLGISVSSCYNYINDEHKRQGDYARGKDHWNYSGDD